MENRHSIKDLLNKIAGFVKSRKGGCIIAAALVLFFVIFLLSSNVETVRQHDNRIEQEDAKRQEALSKATKEPEVSESPQVLTDAAVTPQAVTQEAFQTESASEDTQPDAGTLAQNQPAAQNHAADQPVYENSRPAGDSDSQTAGSVAQNQGNTPAPATQNPGSSGGTAVQPAATKEPEKEEQAYITVTVKIVCDKVIGHPDLKTSASLPPNGVIVNTKTAVKKGATVFDALDAVCRDQNIRYTNKGNAANAYISGIGGLSEGECGRYSGWKYKLNGAVSSLACSRQKIQENDEIEWYYTTTYTE